MTDDVEDDVVWTVGVTVVEEDEEDDEVTIMLVGREGLDSMLMLKSLNCESIDMLR